MRKNYLLFALCALFLFIITPHAYATDYTVEPGSIAASYALPIFMGNTTSSAGSFYGSITQHIYLASELLDAGDNLATEGDITDISFYYTAKSGSTASPVSRTIGIYLMEVESSVTEYTMTAFPYQDIYDNTQYSYQSYFLYNASNKAGTNVYSGTLDTKEVSSPTVDSVKLHLTTPFHWSGNKNIVMTVWDKTATTQSSSNLRFQISSTKTGTAPSEVGHPRFAYTYWTNSSDERASWITEGNYNFSGKLGDYYGANSTANKGEDSQKKQRSYVPKTTFSISTSIPVPTNLAASSITTTSATLSWNAATGATGYNVRWGKTSGSLDYGQNNVAATSLAISDLDDGETYYFDVQTITAGGTSAWASEASFNTTAITHEHNGITFSKWASTTSMPTSGNYYLNDDVTYDFYEGGYLDLAGNLNLCLNGHTINLGTKSINVTNGHTMTIFDHVGGGKITGLVAGEAGSLTFKGVISVENGGTFILREGEVENTFPDDDPEFKSIAIAVGGTLILSGAPGISSNEMDIYLPPTVPAKVITIEPGKPLTNTTPYRVYKESGVLTSGWANMSGADPKDYFVSANPGKSICLREGEAALQTLLTLSETAPNSAINSNDGQIVDVNLTRPLVASQYNTLCLPFALDNTQLEEYFGAGYDLEELTSTSLEDDMLNLTFNKVTALEAGKPYLLQPADDVSSVMFFDDVTIVKTLSNTETEYVDFKGVYSPTELEGGNKNLLFLGADNTLFWPESTGDIKGFRAYFEVKGDARKAVRARIVKGEEADQALDQTSQEPIANSQKLIKDGQLIIERNGKTYNAQGLLIK